MIEIGRVDSVSDGTSLQAVLESEGIPCFLDNANLITADPLLANAVGGMRLLVPPEHELRALQIFNDFVERKRAKLASIGKRSIRFTCESCRQSIFVDAVHAGGVETCPCCAEYTDVPESTVENTVDGVPRITHRKKNGFEITIIEIGLVLALVWFPLFWNAFQYYLVSDEYSYYLFEQLFVDESWRTIRWSTLNIAIVVGITYLTRKGWESLGIVKLQWRRDVMLSIVVVGAFFLLALPWYGFPDASSEEWMPSDATLSSLPIEYQSYYEQLIASWKYERENSMANVVYSLLIALVMNSFAEELSMRTFLIPRLRCIFKSDWTAIAISSALFASYHIYQGLLSVFFVFLFGVILASLFVKYKSIWPLIIGHTSYNAIVMLPFVFYE